MKLSEAAVVQCKELKEKNLGRFFFVTVALHFGNITQFREDFTTDFTDFTDATLVAEINSLSVKFVESVVQFFLVAVLPRCVLLRPVHFWLRLCRSVFFVVHFFLIAAFPRCDLYGQFISNRHAQ
jgi:hypothetical protein